MGFENTVVACYYSFNQSLLLQAEICYKASAKYIDICGFEEFKLTPISQVAMLLLSAGNKIVINPHEPLKAEIDTAYRTNEIKLDLENTAQYDDLLASLNHEGKLLNTCNLTFEKPYRKNSLFLLLQGCIEELKPTFLDGFINRKYKSVTAELTNIFSNIIYEVNE